eukprot:GFKZ01014735.1.p1 GENE.GFKZ01014735.1~~GFKZ01014735.1.p1  ORF type:complete len:427 (-),score=44.67 GFKZ01014735.1:619-1899(-)
MTDANYTRTSPPARTSSLADLVHKTETNPAHHRTSCPRQSPDSDNASQQERNHQRPRPLSNLPRLPIPQAQDVSGTARHIPADCSPKHPYRKRKHSHANPSPNPPDFSSLTQKLDDHASSVAPPVSREQPRRSSPVQPDDERVDKFPPAPVRQEGSTENIPDPVSGLVNLSPRKQRRRIQSKETPERSDLLEENRLLRIELEDLKYRMRKAESAHHKMKKDLVRKENLLEKYRQQLVDRFEAGDGDLFQVNKAKYSADSPGNPTPSKRVDDLNSKVDGESISNSQEEDSSTYSGPSISHAYDEEKSEDRRRRGEKDPYGRSDATIRKHRRTRAPAWTAQEELLFMQAYSKHGCRWKLFQDVLPGRSRRQIQSHGSYLIRQGKLSKKNSRPWQRRKPRIGNEGAGPSSEVKDAEIEVHDGGGGSDRE